MLCEKSKRCVPLVYEPTLPLDYRPSRRGSTREQRFLGRRYPRKPMFGFVSERGTLEEARLKSTFIMPGKFIRSEGS